MKPITLINVKRDIKGGIKMTNLAMQCKSCEGKSFVQAMDFVNLRPMDKKLSIGSERIFTVCLDCGEVVSIKVKNPEKLRKKK